LNGGWVIITKEDCPFCERAKDLLTDRGITYLVFNIDIFPPFRNFIKYQGLTTVPQVYKAGERIGGWEDLARYLGVDTGSPC
jgi:glutaredoxin